jgi:hypothetical protein
LVTRAKGRPCAAVLASLLSLLPPPMVGRPFAAATPSSSRPRDGGACWSSPVIVDGGTAVQGELEFIALRGSSESSHPQWVSGREGAVSPGMAALFPHYAAPDGEIEFVPSASFRSPSLTCQGAERAAALPVRGFRDTRLPLTAFCASACSLRSQLHSADR